MFEITYHHRDELETYQNSQKAYKNGIYDFTFENRFIIYHAEMTNQIHYLAIDMKTGKGSEVMRRKLGEPIKHEQYIAMIPHIINSIKYTGERRNYEPLQHDPIELIDMIFRVILPQYGYAVRNEQVKLSKYIYKGLTGKLVCIAEAEVGTGKTLAYLVAAFVAKCTPANGYRTAQPITITTSSIELQKSILEKDIPLLSKVLMDYGIIEDPLIAVLRKGREHYFCKKRYYDFVDKISKYKRKYTSMLEQFNASNFESRAHDLDLLKLSPTVKSRICVKSSCGKCKYANECKYHMFVDNSMNSGGIDFQITNHNMYLTAMKVEDEGGALLQPSDFVIIDEAHKLKECAESVFGTAVCKHDITSYLRLVKILCKERELGDTYKSVIKNAEVLTNELFSHLEKMTSEEEQEFGHGTLIQLDYNVIKLINSIVSKINYLENSRKKIPGDHSALGLNLARDLNKFEPQSAINTWLEIDENGVLSLCCSPKDIGKILYDTVWDKDTSHVLTSGTMSDGFSFDFFCQENGISRISKHLVSTSTTPSPFDYENHTRLYMPNNMPYPDNNDPEYIKALSEQIVKLVNTTNGHTAILFTSYKVLHAVYEQTKLQLKDYEVICMTRSNKFAISDFKKSKNGVLFASGAMWEGVDCIGDCLSSVIIARLPFPLRSANMEQKKEEMGNVHAFVNTYAIPEMIIKLRQGVGRLIRCENDTGLISILDVRATNRYSKAVGQVMRKYPRVDTFGEIEAFFKAVKPAEYFEDRA